MYVDMVGTVTDAEQHHVQTMTCIRASKWTCRAPQTPPTTKPPSNSKTNSSRWFDFGTVSDLLPTKANYFTLNFNA